MSFYESVLSFLTTIMGLIKPYLMSIPSSIYDIIISRTLTNISYERLVRLINQHALPKGRKLRILDIGVGTAVPLHFIWNSLPLEVEVLGVDYDKSYIQKAQRLFKNIQASGGSRKIELKEMNFYEMDPQQYGTFDIIVFSSSFMLMPQRERALEISKKLLVKGGKLMFILTLQ
jgi:ubiquinone/menaquinone biosynthesis C-methylase UbiE